MCLRFKNVRVVQVNTFIYETLTIGLYNCKVYYGIFVGYVTSAQTTSCVRLTIAFYLKIV